MNAVTDMCQKFGNVKETHINSFTTFFHSFYFLKIQYVPENAKLYTYTKRV